MGLLSIFSLVWGILAVLGMTVAIIPCFGALNYLNIPFAACGLLFSILASIVSSKKELAVAVCILCTVAILLGAVRLVLGLGIF